MANLLRQWTLAANGFVLDIVRLSHPLSMLYLMALNFIFCLIAFNTCKETQLNSLYGLIAFIFCGDLFFTTRKRNLALEILLWVFADFFKSFSIVLCVLAVYELQNDELQRAFFASFGAVASLVISPVYHHHQINIKIAKLFRRLLDSLRQFLIYIVVRPLLFLWAWLDFLLLLRWLPILGSCLRSWTLSAWDWFDSHLFAPLISASRWLHGWIIYFVCFHWCSDLWALAKRHILQPLLTRLGRLLDAFVYVFGCYWLKPLLVRTGRVFIDLTKALISLLGFVGLRVSSLFFQYAICPILLLLSDQMEFLGHFLFIRALNPVLYLLHRKYKQLEDLMLINILGPFFKRFLDLLPERNPFSSESDNELDEFIPILDGEMEAEEDAMLIDGEETPWQTATTDNEGFGLSNSALHSDTSSQMSFDDSKFASGLKQIAISDSESDNDDFLPRKRHSHGNHRRKASASNTLAC